ncbi:MAG: lytic murein transglycosylase [Deltaproteobacteria bacterium]
MSISSFRILSLSVAVFLATFLSVAVAEDDFSTWLAGIRLEARQLGISPTTLDAAFKDLKPIERVVELDHKQPEFTQTFWRYLDLRVTDSRIERGRRLLDLNHDLLSRVEKKYGVQAPFLVSFWGLETNFGDHLGGFPVIGALATLAHDQRRSNFFKNELFAALSILDKKHVSLSELQGSWAGAMGQTQFMPSTFLRFAVDEDGDGRADIWQSLPDVFASSANFLAKSGWRAGQGWGVEVALPIDFNLELTGLQTRKTVRQWRELGIRQLDAAHPTADETQASVILPAGFRGPAFLVFPNYRVILHWNRSDLYAVAVGHLADRLQGQSPLLSTRPKLEVPLSFNQVREMQALLQLKGFQPGPADGVIGSETRSAIKAYQRSTDQPPDGYPTMELFRQLKERKKD